MLRALINSPSDVAGADLRSDALPVGAGLTLVVAYGFWAGVLEVVQEGVGRLTVPAQADHIGIIVADVAVGFLQ
jgi:hypothetical protein